MLQRFDDWPERLHVFIESRRRTLFAWGSHDCALFACDGVLAITGVDLASTMRGRYSDEASARGAITEEMGDEATLEDLAEGIATARFLDEIAVALAGRGDVVLMDSPAGPALGLCVGAVAVFASPAGTALVNMSRVRRAWAIGLR